MAKSRPHWRQVRWRSGSSTSSERAGRAPTGQRAESVAQQRGLARSVGARDGHEGPAPLRALTPTSESFPTLSERAVARQTRGCGRCRPCGRGRPRPQELAKPRRRGFAQPPQPSSSSSSSRAGGVCAPGPAHRQLSRICQISVTADKAERFIQTALREWAYARAYRTSRQRAAHLTPWLHRYNWHRPHGSLNY